MRIKSKGTDAGKGREVRLGSVKKYVERTAAKRTARVKAAARRRKYERYLWNETLSRQEFQKRLNNFYFPFYGTEEQADLIRKAYRKKYKEEKLDLDRIERENPEVFKGLSELVYEIQLEGRKYGAKGWPLKLRNRWFRKAVPRLYEAYKILRIEGRKIGIKDLNKKLGLGCWPGY